MTPHGVDPFADAAGEPATDMPPSNGGGPRTEPEGGTPTAQDTGQGSAPPADGQGNELLKPQDFGAFENWDEVKTAFEGEKEADEDFELPEDLDPKDIAKQYTHLRAKWTQDSQKIADLEREITQLKQTPPTPPQPQKTEPRTKELTPEKMQELQDIYMSDPIKGTIETLKAMPDVLQEALSGVPGFDRLMKTADKVEANEIVSDLRGTHKDFQNYEKQIMDEFQNMGEYSEYFGSIPDGKGVELMYRAVKAETLLNNIYNKLGKGMAANMVTNQQNKGLQNLGPSGHIPTNNGKTVNIRGIEVTEDDLGFVEPSKLARLR